MDDTITTERPTAAELRDGATPLQVLLALSAKTFGWFRSVDARAHGVLPSTLTWFRSSGVIESPKRGINRLTSVEDRWEGRALAALWSAGRRAALGRHAALHLWGLWSGHPDIDVVTPRAKVSTCCTVPVRTHARLRAGDVVQRGMFQVTSLAFTICDLAAVMTEKELLRLADRAVASSHMTLDDLREMVDRFREIGGVETLRAVLSQLDPASRWTRSDGERMWLRIVGALGVEPPRANTRTQDTDQRRRYLDFAWEHFRIAVEIDLHPIHGTTLGRREDGHRQNALVLAGWTVLRFDLADLMMRPDQVRETVARALANAGA